MRYTSDEYVRLVDHVLLTNRHVYFIEDVIALTGVTKNEFSYHYPKDGLSYEQLKTKLRSARFGTKATLRENMLNGSVKDQEKLARLLMTDEERRRVYPVASEIRSAEVSQLPPIVISLGAGVNPEAHFVASDDLLTDLGSTDTEEQEKPVKAAKKAPKKKTK